MDEIIQRYNDAVELYSPLWEHRIQSYNDKVAAAIAASWKDVGTLIKMIQDGASES